MGGREYRARGAAQQTRATSGREAAGLSMDRIFSSQDDIGLLPRPPQSAMQPAARWLRIGCCAGQLSGRLLSGWLGAVLLNSQLCEGVGWLGAKPTTTTQSVVYSACAALGPATYAAAWLAQLSWLQWRLAGCSCVVGGVASRCDAWGADEREAGAARTGAEAGELGLKGAGLAQATATVPV
jgi:hypothetical protein